MDFKEKVSVIIPTYKRADFLARAINSVLNQSYENLEVLVIDDNNPESLFRSETENIMKQFSENQKVIYIQHSFNMNGSVARNTGIKKSSGDLIAFLDDDNYFYKDKIRKQVDFLNNHKNYKAVYCGLIDSNNKIKYANRSGNLMFEQLSGSQIIDTNTILIKKSVVLEFEGWDERLKRNQDVSFMIRFFSKDYEIGCLDEVLVYYDLEDRSNFPNSTQSEFNMYRFLQLYKEEINLIKRKNPLKAKLIYLYRYRQIFFSHIKSKKIKKSFIIFLKMLNIDISLTAKLLINSIKDKIIRV
ncbi:glycosyltransferase family 2 protein [Facklamia sp. P9177]|uniref:glycosyltransferase family 2 protein n=1 Tax=Facklamia sp. P9177 TaxID=3421945 RepID=UPI003D16A36F